MHLTKLATYQIGILFTGQTCFQTSSGCRLEKNDLLCCSQAESLQTLIFIYMQAFFCLLLGYRISVNSYQAREPTGYQTNLRYARTTA